jgi:hypothetical protein
MAVTFTRGGNPVTDDFLFTPEDGAPYVVPYGNLLVWDNEELARHGVTRVITLDVPPVISDRQFFQNLANRLIISREEALAAVQTGAIPAAMEVYVSALPPDDQFAARMLLSGATTFDRRHPLVAAFSLAFGWTAQDIDTFWLQASAL